MNDRPKRKAIKSKDPFISNPIQMIKNQVNYEINSAKKKSLLLLWGSKETRETINLMNLPHESPTKLLLMRWNIIG